MKDETLLAQLSHKSARVHASKQYKEGWTLYPTDEAQDPTEAPSTEEAWSIICAAYVAGRCGLSPQQALAAVNADVSMAIGDLQEEARGVLKVAFGLEREDVTDREFDALKRIMVDRIES